MANLYKIAFFLCATVSSVILGYPASPLMRVWHYGTFNETVADAIQINKAIMARPVDGETIRKIVTKRSRQLRLRIAEIYESKYKRKLVTDLEEKLESPNLREGLVSLITSSFQYYAEKLYNILNGRLPSVDGVIEIIGDMNNAELATLASTYTQTYNKDLLEDIKRTVAHNNYAATDFVSDLIRRYQESNMYVAPTKDSMYI